ncbi:hypothetical protein [Pontixanthobacter aquaemixtae]|uniref:Uncharacterized protein n=1 Tax=Pontixanthobacter aquaemixtae TaxID=1958940 RepID=A0A844ZVF9_9SPHN|nr:hypothetical protein [Pontixanthobacter aquaemixtae]MXO89519.1 hypothetical protein [Pontixanthobacter aquaemixtae]
MFIWLVSLIKTLNTNEGKMNLNRGARKRETNEGQQPETQPEEAPAPVSNNPSSIQGQTESANQSNERGDLGLQSHTEVAPRTEESMDAAWWGVGADWASTILSFFSVLLVIYALRQTNKSLRLAQKDRAAATRRSISQSAETTEALKYGSQSAEAMTRVAESMENNATHIKESVEASKRVADQQMVIGRMQMRPILSVLIGRATYQDSRHNFSVCPIIRNTGNSAAKNVRFRIVASILPALLPQDFKFWLPESGRGGSNTIGPGQTGDMYASIDDRVHDDAIPKIKAGIENALYVWGYLSYQDAFKKTYRTTFAQQIFWRQTGIAGEDGFFPEAIEGIYLGRHNRSN